MILPKRAIGLVVVIAGLAAASAYAQPGGGRGRGGFGGPPGMGGPGMGGPLMLVQNPAVQKEIGLEGEGIERVQKIAGAYRDEMMAESEKAGLTSGGPQQFEGLSPEERETKMREMAEKRQAIATKLNEKFMPQLKEVLSASQIERVQQIALQAGGSQALTRPDVVKALDLTKEQQEKITGINQEFAKKLNELGPGGRGGRAGGGGGAGGAPADFQGMMAKRQELTKERDSQATEVLTKEQQEKYEKMKGKPFDLAQLMQFGPGGGPGGRRGPGSAGGGPGGGSRGAAGRPQKNAEKTE